MAHTIISGDMMTMMNMLASTESGWLLLAQIGAGLALAMGALGSSLGIGAAGQAAAGAWAKEGKTGKTLSFTYIILLSMPISQTFYAMIVMNQMNKVFASPELTLANIGILLGVGLATGTGEFISAWVQGLIGAAGIRSLSESGGKGFAFILIAMGVIETVGILTMVFMLGLVPKVIEVVK